MQHLKTTSPTCTPCPRCGRLELTGHDEGIAYRADPAPLTLHAELAARQAGRHTWNLIAGQLAYRNPTRIAGDARGRPPVLAQHRCEHPPTADDIDHVHVAVVAQLVARATREDDEPSPVTDGEFDLLCLLGRELDATIIDRTNEKAPF